MRAFCFPLQIEKNPLQCFFISRYGKCDSNAGNQFKETDYGIMVSLMEKHVELGKKERLKCELIQNRQNRNA